MLVQKTTSVDPITVQNEEQLWSSGTIGFYLSKELSYSVHYYNCEVFGFRAMYEHVSLMTGQYEFVSDKDGVKISKNVQEVLEQRKVDVKTIKQYAANQPSTCRSIVQRILNAFETVEDFTESHFKARS